MIDINFLRENPEIVKENIRKKFQDLSLDRNIQCRNWLIGNKELG